MKKIYSTIFLAILCSSVMQAQLAGGVTYPINGVSSAPTSFSTIQDAATYLKANGVTGTGNVILELQTGYNPAAEPVAGILIEAMPGVSSSNRVIFRPAAGFSTTISLSVAGNGAINLMKASYVTIDGRQGGIGVSNSIAVSNSNTGTTDSSSALKFGNDTRFCEVRNCDLSASNKAVNYGGVVLFSKGVTTGVSNNKLYKCNIDGKGLVIKGINSRGTGNVTSTTQNQFDTIRSCNVYDYFNLSNVYGIYIQEYSTDWTIDSNNIYQTVSRNFLTAGNCIMYGIITGVNWTSDEQYIADNFIGGNAPGAAGTLAIQSTGTNAIGFFGIATNSGGPNHLIYRNTIKNVTVNYAASAGSFANNAIQEFVGYNGTGYVYNNVIDNISITNTAGSAITYPVEITNSLGSNTNIFGSFFTYNNKISNITATSGALSTHAAVIYGFRLDANSASGVTSGACIPYNELYGNKVTNLSATSTALVSTGSGVRGISTSYTQTSAGTTQLAMDLYMERDTISGLTTNSASTSLSTPGAVGILANAGGTVALIDTAYILNNVVTNISNTNTNDINNAVTGILATNCAYHIDSNTVADLRNAAPGTVSRPNIFGINVRTVFKPSRVTNNQVAIGNGQNTNTQVYGIVNNVNTTDSLKISYNSVVISGAPASGAFNSSAIYRGSDTLAPVIAVKTPFLVTDNLAINKRAGGTGNHTAISSQSSAAPVGFSANYNAFVSGNIATMGRWGASFYDFGNWKTTTSLDSNSYYAQSNAATAFNVNPAQINTANLFTDVSYDVSGKLSVNTANVEAWLLNGKGIAIPGSGPGRSVTVGTPTDIGFDEFTTNAGNLPPAVYASASPAASTTTSYIFAGRKLGEISWGASVPTSILWSYYSGIPGPGTTGAVINAYHNVAAAGTPPYNYDMKLYYTLAEQNQIADAALTGLKKDAGVAWYNIGGTPGVDVAGKFVTSTGLTNFSQFTLKDIANTTIPVKVEYFRGSNQLNAHLLDWKVSPLNTFNATLSLERSGDGRNFSSIYTVSATAIRMAQPFAYSNSNLLNGINYYRLKMTDENGLVTFSSIVALMNANKGLALINIAPNPVSADGKFKLNISSAENAKIQVSITDMSGRLVMKQDATVANGFNSIDMNVSNLAAGIYQLFGSAADGRTTVLQFVKR